MQNDILKHMVYSNQQIICHAIVQYFWAGMQNPLLLSR